MSTADVTSVACRTGRGVPQTEVSILLVEKLTKKFGQSGLESFIDP